MTATSVATISVGADLGTIVGLSGITLVDICERIEDNIAMYLEGKRTSNKSLPAHLFPSLDIVYPIWQSAQVYPDS